jgi:large subunit ribosomal protein L21
MYAVVQVGKDQYKVSEGELIDVDLMKEEDGKQVTLDHVLVYAKGSDIRIGQPTLPDVKVEAVVDKQALGEKVVTLKYRRRKDSSTKTGHRKKLTTLKITKISA